MPYIRREWRGMAIIGIMTIAAAGVSALMPWPLKLLVDYALDDQNLPGTVAKLFAVAGLEPDTTLLIIMAGVASFVLFALNTALGWGLTWTWAVSGYRMMYDLAADIFARLQRLSLLYHGKRHVGDLLSRISTDSWCVYKLAADLLVRPAANLLTICTVSIIAWTLDRDK